MDKITKVKEVSSFIKNFDGNNWNEIILRLTIIGIRYVRNKCKNFFRWRIEDLSFISEQLKSSKQASNNYKVFYGNKISHIINRNNNINIFDKINFNYGNNSLNKKESKGKKISSNKNKVKTNIKSKSLINNKVPNTNLNNNISLLLSDREPYRYNYENKTVKNNGKYRENIKLQKPKEKKNLKIDYSKPKNYYEDNNLKDFYIGKTKRSSNRNKISSLNHYYNNNDMNIVISDFPFSDKNQKINDNTERSGLSNINRKNGDILKLEQNNNNSIIYDTFDNNNSNKYNDSYILKKTYELKCPEELNNNSIYLSKINSKNQEIKEEDENYLKNQKDFINKLRKMNHSKDKDNDKEISKKKSIILYPTNIYIDNKTYSLIDKNIEFNYEDSYKGNNNFETMKENIIGDKNNNSKIMKNQDMDEENFVSKISKQFKMDNISQMKN